MLNVNRFNNSSKLNTKKSSTNKNVEKTKSGVSFNQILNETMQIEDNVKEDLIVIIDNIDKYGEIFSNKPNIDTLEQYKRSVKNFLKIVSKRIHKVQKLYSKHEYNIIQTIDKNLEELTLMIVNYEKNRFKLLEKIGEIRGLIIDIVGK